MRRPLLSSYVCVGAGLLLGAYVGIFVIQYDPPIMGWFFGTGTGLSLGAFVAALVSGTPLAGSPSQPQRRGVIPRNLNVDDLDAADDWDEDEEDEAPLRR
jgi:hypothetical protein